MKHFIKYLAHRGFVLFSLFFVVISVLLGGTACGTKKTAGSDNAVESETAIEADDTSDAADITTNTDDPSLSEEPNSPGDLSDETDSKILDPDGSYTTKEDVSLYLVLYDELPGNFITKNEARKLGWEGGSLEPYAPGKCIGGDHFGNYEGHLPEEAGREYYECDIDTLYANSRGAKRIVYSDDGLIFFTEDHYNNFEQLY